MNTTEWLLAALLLVGVALLLVDRVWPPRQHADQIDVEAAIETAAHDLLGELRDIRSMVETISDNADREGTPR